LPGVRHEDRVFRIAMIRIGHKASDANNLPTSV
jgi:hypothetical protein